MVIRWRGAGRAAEDGSCSLPPEFNSPPSVRQGTKAVKFTTSLRDTDPVPVLEHPHQRDGAARLVSFAFGVVQVGGASLEISPSPDAPTRVTCWSCWEDVQPRADPGAAGEVPACLLAGQGCCCSSGDVRTSCAIEFL